MLQLEKTGAMRAGEVDLVFHDMRVWQLLLRSKNPDGTWAAVLERNILIELDIVEDPDFVRLIKNRLASAVELGLIERVDVRGKIAYRWKEPIEGDP